MSATVNPFGGVHRHNLVPSSRDSQLIDETQTIRIPTETKGAAALALQMIDQATQCNILSTTSRTMVDFLSMHRTTEVLVEAVQLSKAPLAEITPVPGSIPSSAGRQSGGRAVAVPADLLVGEDVVRIDLAAVLVNLLAVDAGWAGARFEMEAYSSEVGEHVGAPRAFGVLSSVDGRLEMLFARTSAR